MLTAVFDKGPIWGGGHAYLQTCFSVVQVGHHIFPVLSGTAHFGSNGINLVFSGNARDKVTVHNYGIKL